MIYYKSDPNVSVKVDVLKIVNRQVTDITKDTVITDIPIYFNLKTDNSCYKSNIRHPIYEDVILLSNSGFVKI